MSRRVRILHSTIALAAAATVLSSCSEDDADASSPAFDTSSTQATASSSPPDMSQVEMPPGGALLLPSPDANGDIVIEESGRYRIALSDTLSLDVDLPQTAVVFGDGLYVQLDDAVLKLETAGETYGVPEDPCLVPHYLTPAGTTVDRLVSAIRRQPPYRTTTPQAVEIGDADGQYLELRIPPSYDASSCDEGQVGLPGNSGSNNNMEPGYTGEWWIVDVGGQRAVLQALCEKCDDPTTNRITRMVRGVTFSSTS